jgi:hypothetical protein
LSWKDWAGLGIAILGIILFLVGANSYNVFVGWLGVFLFVGGILAIIVLYVYNALSKNSGKNKP